MTARLLASALITLSITACASSSGAVRVAREAELRQDYDRAVVEYSRALNTDAGNVDARTGLHRAKTRAAIIHYDRGRQLAAAGKLSEAVSEYQVAAEMNPAGAEIQEALRSAQDQLRAQVPVNRDGKTELESLIDRTRDMPPAGGHSLVGANTALPDIVFRNGSSQVDTGRVMKSPARS